MLILYNHNGNNNQNVCIEFPKSLSLHHKVINKQTNDKTKGLKKYKDYAERRIFRDYRSQGDQRR